MSDTTSTRTQVKMGRIVTAATTATTIEWFDFAVYATAASLVLGELFFPNFSSVAGTLSSYATLAVGFIARPIGGIIAGHLGDKVGRKPVLVAALIVMGLATTLIGLLPTYAAIGVWAPVLLVVLRLVQGLGVGAQWGGATLLLTESAPAHRRGFYGSFTQVGAILGFVLGNTAFLLVEVLVPEGAVNTWGWRLPFLTGIVLVAISAYINKRVEDTPVFKEMQQARESTTVDPASATPKRSPLGQVVRHHWKTIGLAAGAFMVVNSAYYIFAAGMLSYGTKALGYSSGEILAIVVLAGLTQVITMPLAGHISDKVGRRPIYLVGCALMALWAVPLFLLVDTGVWGLTFLGLVLGYTFHSMMYGPQAALYAELFPAEVRYSGASLGYQLASIFAGGLAPFIMTGLLAATGSSLSVAGYIIAMAVITFASVYAMAETSRRSLYHEKEPATV
ncbi:MAG: MFS transporter [Streptosporangiales bacterium]|nr:MFS transporter [Streptosporangiales bacterium]